MAIKAESHSQHFWASMVAAAGAGPPPIPHRSLDSAQLAAAIRTCLAPETAKAAGAIAARMKGEHGVREAANSFHRNLPIDTMSCDLLERQNAVWLWRGKNGRSLKLSDRAAYILLINKKIATKDVEL